MRIYLAGTQGDKGNVVKDNKGLYLLESFYYMQDSYMKGYGQHHFLLDSGAYTFKARKKNQKDQKDINWIEYLEKYAFFIKKHNIDLFFELDIDDVVGLKKVEEYRSILEKITNKQCIPVWHKSRGKDYWFKMIQEYNYVALGGMVSNMGYKGQVEKVFPWFLKTARENNCKVHALGYTSLKGLKKYRFYSVDSTSWIAGQKFAVIPQYIGNGNFKMFKKGENQKGINPKLRLKYGFDQWVKFQKYALNNL